MSVPDYWCPGFTGKNLNGGVIARVDLDINTNNHFQLELDNEPGAFYAMRYDAVALYADEMHHLYSSFRLPTHALAILHMRRLSLRMSTRTMMTMMNF
jgi:hypothetical protein